MDILKTLEKLNALAVDEPRHFLGITLGYDRDEISMLISLVKASLPDELKTAAATVREKEQILDQAREDARRIIEKAQDEAKQLVADSRMKSEKMLEEARVAQETMVSESTIYELAKSQGDKTLAAAEQYAASTRREVDKYAYDMLARLEGTLSKALQVVDVSKSELERDLGREAVVQVPMRPRPRN